MAVSDSILVSFSIALLLCLALQTKGFSHAIRGEEVKIKRSDFPEGFIFGAGSSAMQVEGAIDKFGKGPTMWEDYIQKYPERIQDNSDFSVAIDHYNRYKSDVQLIKKLGVEHYRLSIAWTRILPNGSLSGGVNQEGIDHYNSLIDELLANGIQPFVSLLHFDTPLALQNKYGGPLSRSFVEDFKEYSDICFKRFGDRVKYWATINEPFMVAAMGHSLGATAPGRCSSASFSCPVQGNSSTEPYIVMHNFLLAHAAAVNLYRHKYQKDQGGEIGLCTVAEFCEPYDADSPDDQAAAKRSLDFLVGWVFEPLVFGKYPDSMVKLVKDRLPSFTEEEKKMIKGAFDFIGINYYTSRYCKNVEYNPDKPPNSYFADMLATEMAEKDGVPIGHKAGGQDFFYSYPEGLEKILLFIKTNYRSPTLYITENGISEESKDYLKLEQALNDTNRILYISEHLQKVSDAIKKGVNVKGYFAWTAFDDFEFEYGYVPRYGFYYIDYKNNLQRIPKRSASWYRSFLKNYNDM